MTKKLETKNAAQIILSDKPWVNLKDALIELPHDTYTISVSEKHSVVIFTGDTPPQEPGTVFEIANKVLDTVGQMGNIKMIISAGGYLPSDNGKGNRVFGVGTDKKAIETLKSFELKPLSSEVKSITWFNGVILGIAKNRKIEGIGLFGEIQNAESPQYKAASNILKVLEKIIKTKIDTKELDDKVVDEPVEIKKDGPGIG